MKTEDRGGGDPIDRLEAGGLAHRRPKRTRDCPDEQRLRLLLPGQVEPEEAERLLTHAAECDWCGTVLREAAQDLTEPPTAEEEELAGNSQLADPGRRRELAERIVPRKPDPKPWQPILRWWPAGALAAAALVGGIWYQQWTLSAAHTGGLLAQAYTKHRQMEMRLPGAEWGRERTQMSAKSSSFNEPVELTDAISNIKRAIDAHPDDPKWLQLEGRAELMEGKEDEAIAELERARSLRPAEATILVDLGTAYYQKAEKTNPDNPKAFSSAYDAYTEGLRLKPGDPTLLFDQALAAERIYVYNAARQAWEAYLRIDSQSRWAGEARSHLENVKKNLTDSGSTPLPPHPTR